MGCSASTQAPAQPRNTDAQPQQQPTNNQQSTTVAACARDDAAAPSHQQPTASRAEKAAAKDVAATVETVVTSQPSSSCSSPPADDDGASPSTAQKLAGGAVTAARLMVDVGASIQSSAAASLAQQSALAPNLSSKLEVASSCMSRISVLSSNDDMVKVLSGAWVMLSESAKFFTIGKIAVAALEQVYSMWNCYSRKSVWLGEFICYLKLLEQDLMEGLERFQHTGMLRVLEQQLEKTRKHVEIITSRSKSASMIMSLMDEATLKKLKDELETVKAQCLTGHVTEIKNQTKRINEQLEEVLVILQQRNERLKSLRNFDAQKMQELQSKCSSFDFSTLISSYCTSLYVHMRRSNLSPLTYHSDEWNAYMTRVQLAACIYSPTLEDYRSKHDGATQEEYDIHCERLQKRLLFKDDTSEDVINFNVVTEQEIETYQQQFTQQYSSFFSAFDTFLTFDSTIPPHQSKGHLFAIRSLSNSASHTSTRAAIIALLSEIYCQQVFGTHFVARSDSRVQCEQERDAALKSRAQARQDQWRFKEEEKIKSRLKRRELRKKQLEEDGEEDDEEEDEDLYKLPEYEEQPETPESLAEWHLSLNDTIESQKATRFIPSLCFQATQRFDAYRQKMMDEIAALNNFNEKNSLDLMDELFCNPMLKLAAPTDGKKRLLLIDGLEWSDSTASDADEALCKFLSMDLNKLPNWLAIVVGVPPAKQSSRINKMLTLGNAVVIDSIDINLEQNTNS